MEEWKGLFHHFGLALCLFSCPISDIPPSPCPWDGKDEPYVRVGGASPLKKVYGKGSSVTGNGGRRFSSHLPAHIQTSAFFFLFCFATIAYEKWELSVISLRSCILPSLFLCAILLDTVEKAQFCWLWFGFVILTLSLLRFFPLIVAAGFPARGAPAPP